ncbi:hypothetical protein HELRODRAFT_164265 [Helobdella robusta]|uniref:Uncharacterized protein n=1 Tax=Helobdella robusta TaxID=6412 RepID=T1EV65_HELRO|nr:hypothetical protein HELRODRAFT_164265 [Helobdella robusta]ESN94425.1 hypothetical protein HELRODRAFT_164265 [Helobdella robusta]
MTMIDSIKCRQDEEKDFKKIRNFRMEGKKITKELVEITALDQIFIKISSLMRHLERTHLEAKVEDVSLTSPLLLLECFTGSGSSQCNKNNIVIQGRLFTTSIAVPGSILNNAQSAELKTYLVGQLFFKIFFTNVDAVFIALICFNDKFHRFIY